MSKPAIIEDPPPVDCELPPNTITHVKWGLSMPNRILSMDMEHPIVNVLLSHTDTPRCHTKEECVSAMQALQTAAFDRASLGANYNFVVGGDGNLYEARGWLDKPPKYWMYKELTACKTLWIAYFGFKGDKVSDEEKKVTDQLIKLGIERRYIIEKPVFYSDL